MALPEIPEWMNWSITRQEWPYLQVALQLKTITAGSRTIESKLVNVTDLRDEKAIINQVETMAAYIYQCFERKRELEQIVERNWPDGS